MPNNNRCEKPVLNVENISMKFGGLMAVNEAKLEVGLREIVALIGPNGAGKTTFFNCISGIYKPTAGNVFLCNHDKPEASPLSLIGKKPHTITKLGMSRTFQNIRLFPNMSVLENVMVARTCRTKAGILGALFRNKATRLEEEQIANDSYELLKEVKLEHLYAEDAKNLPYGDQRRLEIARALATEPFILLLDEPAAGMNPHETEELKAFVLYIREKYKLSILLIEHDMKMVMSLSDHIYVMEYGCMLADGVPSEIRQNPAVIKAYLGEE
ncbi:ABC transporter ATP-binding protein [Desulfovibrio litoralis]|uniref:Amino acid/amide ABC transporter ATP-binding protein 1, HAAT family n=1 Tax=Desulfovibrio litoralis DSM 11393 TaxID=1121455 RepID=A0A1M7TQR4_9BACT|nr:ABC transporter ATP-binding protein [Desulfovibrio litoralis]SHN73016.1 amino acid/amide ABC transporter ATP-binding protein 1, HAAT family [Desulfovibrio litoralis DSM 11393]